MSKGNEASLKGELLDEMIELSLVELCRVCRLAEEQLFELVDYGVLEPLGTHPDQWRFRARSVRRVQCVIRLQRDLGVNVAGAALALDLLEEIKVLRMRQRAAGPTH
jgi:chaperone modulatory protein CbpM